jgi:uncharacterized membrane protein YeaQ/YmgE (transglycosylase-associated protein family)
VNERHGDFSPSLEVLVVVSLAEVLILQGLDRATDVGGRIRSDPVPSWGLSKVVALFQRRLAWGETRLMLALWWLLTIGILTGLVTRTVVGGEAYGLVADALLGITGAFAVDWMLGVVTHTTISWSNCTLFTIWGAAALPLLAHFFARRQTARRLQGSPVRH